MSEFSPFFSCSFVVINILALTCGAMLIASLILLAISINHLINRRRIDSNLTFRPDYGNDTLNPNRRRLIAKLRGQLAENKSGEDAYSLRFTHINILNAIDVDYLDRLLKYQPIYRSEPGRLHGRHHAHKVILPVSEE